MELSAWREDCTAWGWRLDEEAGTVDGLTESGVAFRAIPSLSTAILAVRIATRKVPKLQETLTADPRFSSLRVVGTDSDVRLFVPMEAFSPADLRDLLLKAAQTAIELASTSFSDKLETGREPVIAYLRGVAGALAGALLGALPWFLVQWLLSWNLWLLGGLVGIVSFCGYVFLWGAHSTPFALTSVVVCSLLVTTAYITGAWFLHGEYAALLAMLADEGLTATADVLVPAIAQSIGSELVYGWLICGLGLVGIRRHILDYTHERLYLRSHR